MTLLDPYESWDHLQRRAKPKLKDIEQSFLELRDRDEDRDGWGQFLDPPAHRDHQGIYGTGSGVQILSLRDEDAHAELIQESQEWLISEWGEPDSNTVAYGYTELVYKFVFCLFGLADNDTALPGGSNQLNASQQETVAEFIDDLWNRYQGHADGWGEYWYDGDSGEVALDATALALLALIGDDDKRTQDEFTERLVQLGKMATQEGAEVSPRQLGQKKDTVLGVALALLTLSRYRNVRGEDNTQKNVLDQIDEVANTLESLIRYYDDIDPNTYSMNLISLPDSIVDEKPEARPEQYVIFTVYPIIATSLLEAGDGVVARNHIFIQNVIEAYIDALDDSEKDCFVASETGHCSTHDHLWIGLALKQFIDTNVRETPRLSRWRGHARAKWGGVALLGVLLGIGLAAAVYQQITTSDVVSGVLSIVILLIGVLLRSVRIMELVRGWLRRFSRTLW